jgi:hypothetical protein
LFDTRPARTGAIGTFGLAFAPSAYHTDRPIGGRRRTSQELRTAKLPSLQLLQS